MEQKYCTGFVVLQRALQVLYLGKRQFNILTKNLYGKKTTMDFRKKERKKGETREGAKKMDQSIQKWSFLKKKYKKNNFFSFFYKSSHFLIPSINWRGFSEKPDFNVFFFFWENKTVFSKEIGKNRPYIALLLLQKTFQQNLNCLKLVLLALTC